ncbi:MAG: helix-turn-helix transcriptional regulator [Ktedonobacteraceae bacterium]|nr:helix-turn-helix transcriptional regulator [Ktedonobacteraceae bacterium]
MDDQPRLPNDRLRHQRELRGWSQKRVADELRERFEESGATAKDVGRWERGIRIPGPFYRERLCLLFGRTADQLGFIDPSSEEDQDEPTYQPAVAPQREQAPELGDIMASFNHSRRGFLGAVLAGASTAAIPKGALSILVGAGGIGQQTLQHFEKLNEICWDLSNNNQLELAEQILGIYLPRISIVAHQPSSHQPQAASLVARGYILAAEVDKQNVVAMQAYAQQAVFYSQLTEDYNVQCDALRQEATIALIAKQPFKALMSYQKALPLLDKVTPLLRSRMYLGLASAFARCNPALYKQEALRYLGMANEHFPAKPEDDLWFRYMYSTGSRSVVSLYEALTYNDLKQPKDAWKSLMHVDGLHPKLPVTDSSRLEFLNLQAKAAADLGNLEESCAYLEASVQGADATGYTVWREEAADVYQEMVKLWPHELQVRRLGRLFQLSKGA